MRNVVLAVLAAPAIAIVPFSLAGPVGGSHIARAQGNDVCKGQSAGNWGFAVADSDGKRQTFGPYKWPLQVQECLHPCAQQ